MPKDGDYGYSAETWIKNRTFLGLVKMHTQMLKNKVTEGRPYIYLDLNAGPGRYYPEPKQPLLWDDHNKSALATITGSPLLFLASVEIRGIPYRAHFCESCPSFRDALRANMHDRTSVEILDDNARAPVACAGVPLGSFGLVYSDETGHIPPFDLLGELSRLRGFSTIDFLIYYAAAIHKRVRRVHGGDDLQSCLRRIRKSHWHLREPHTNQQWTFLLGTNWAAMPAWRRAGFWPVDSPEGQSVLHRLTYSKKEVAEQEKPDDGLQYLF